MFTTRIEYKRKKCNEILREFMYNDAAAKLQNDTLFIYL